MRLVDQGPTTVLELPEYAQLRLQGHGSGSVRLELRTDRGTPVFDLQGERSSRFRQGQAGKGRAETSDGKISVDRRVLPRTAPVEAQIRFAPECCLLAEQFDQRTEVEIVGTKESVDVALATDRFFPRLTGQDCFEREWQEQFAAHQARTPTEKLNILDRKSLFPEIKRQGKRERSAIKKKPGNVNVAG